MKKWLFSRFHRNVVCPTTPKLLLNETYIREITSPRRPFETTFPSARDLCRRGDSQRGEASPKRLRDPAPHGAIGLRAKLPPLPKFPADREEMAGLERRAPRRERARLAALTPPHRKPPRAGKRRAPLRLTGWQAPRQGGGRGGRERGRSGGGKATDSPSPEPVARRCDERGQGLPPPARPGLRGDTGYSERLIQDGVRSPPPPPPRAPPFCLLLQTLSEPPSAGPGAWHRPRPPPPRPATTPLRFPSPHAVAPAA